MSPFFIGEKIPLQRIHISLFLLLITISTSLFASVSAQTVACDTDSELTRETYSSGILGQTMYYTVYTPPCYDPTSPYPVMYLMHGSNEDDGHWQRLGLPTLLDVRITNGTLDPVIVVMPFGNVIANRNNFDTLSWRTIFLTELLPDVESAYAISTERQQRAIGGISRGGFWAYQIGLSTPEQFSVIGGHSAFFDEFHAPPEHNPLDLALDAPELETFSLWLDRGVDDFAAPGLDIMSERLNQRGVDYTYEIYPEGEHNNTYWSAHIADYLDFYAQITTSTSAQTTVAATSTSAPVSSGGFATNTPLAPVATTPTPATSTQSNADTNQLILPAVAFPSLQTSIPNETLRAVANGTLDANLVLSETMAGQLTVHPDTRIVPDAALRNELWQNRDRYTLLTLDALTIQYRILFVDDLPATTYPDYVFAGNTDQLTRFTFSGVTALARNTRVAINTNSVEWATEAIAPYVTASDAFHMSNEVSFVAGCPQSNATLLGGATSFCSLPTHFDIFTQLEVDVVELTGNHNNDYGYDAYRDTFAFFAQNNISTVGGGETLVQAQTPYILNHNGNTVGLVACNIPGPYYALVNDSDENALGGFRPGATPCDWAWLEATLPTLADEVDVLVVSVQYEEIEDYLPTQQQTFDFRRLANLGADVVLGSQAHKPQTFEFYPTQRGEVAFLHYGLGNFYFDQPFWGNMRFFLDTLYIHDGALRGIELLPGIIDDLARPRPMTADESVNFLFFMFVEQNGF